MSYREELEQQNSQILDEGDLMERAVKGAPAGARQNVRMETEQGAGAQPGGAAQNSGGARAANGADEGNGG